MNGDLHRAQRLAAQLHDMRTVACALPDGLALLDHDDRLRWCNPAAERLLGIRWPRDRGAPARDCFGAQGAAVWALIESGDAQDIAAPTDDAVRLALSLTAYGAHRQLLVARDISQVRRLEQVRRDFVANVSHELRTPLTVIHGYLELLSPEDVPALAGVLQEMRVQSQRMRQIVEDLLMLSHLEMQQSLDEERVPMAPLLDGLRHEAEALSQGRHRIQVQRDAQFDLMGSPRDLHSAFSNLVSNAVRYTPDGGDITIAWRPCAGGAEYAVIDTGYGIPAEHLPRLTERFYRVSSSRSRASGGTGLGLSIVKHVLNLHGAELRIESTPGKGSTFACVFKAERLLPASA
ncbi:MAG: phosphate regulon sensor histidine kinase PhoR [Rhodanobacter sp.]|nr:MAG: phosphate regulon sensor histidine kinase PhoR [Rhodanobacter sp.]TAM13774.1 MAG: phosphate regulon sensor histidine kinase PhoR [Rhodanobacter sp.]TAM34502.1 MAG: phosphate regulon sensor histidine kinase PhoR [Rhodanobacter sp.]